MNDVKAHAEETPYNPLDKRNLGVSVADALLAKPMCSLPPPMSFVGAGIYAIYYAGECPFYAPFVQRNLNNQVSAPIYVGKAVPSGARKGGCGLDIPTGRVLFNRLYEHAASIRQCSTLRIEDFSCRYLVVDDIWIPLGEALMIQKFSPPWNVAVDGFGNHDPGNGRYNQQCSAWDVLHPGRSWVTRVKPNMRSLEQIRAALDDLFTNT